jgi:DNA-binding beta-propeller fold protein YncE
MKMKRTMLKECLACLIVAMFLTSCGETDHSTSTGSDIGAIGFKVVWRGAPTIQENSMQNMRALDCVAAGITRVRFDVRDEHYTNLVTKSFACSLGQGSVDGIPVGIDRTLIVEGEDAGGAVVYRGEKPGITVIKNQYADAGEIVCDPVSAEETTLYLRDGFVLSEEMGAPIPWLTNYIYPQGTTTISWQTVLKGDILGLYSYSIDIVESTAAATIKIEFIIDQTTVASETKELLIVNSGFYDTIANSITGTDLKTEDGDVLTFKISYQSGTEHVAVGLDGDKAHNDSHVQLNFIGPVACFTADPETGEPSTLFNFNASCSNDAAYLPADLEVRWDWENDGVYDTVFSNNKTADHQYAQRGIKNVKLQVKNPGSFTRTTIKPISIPLATVDYFLWTEQGAARAGLAWDGTNLWLSGLNKDTIYKLSVNGDLIDSFASPCEDPMGLAWDGAYLWVIDAWGADEVGSVLYKVDTTDGTVMTSFSIEKDLSTGLTWDGGFLWASDAANDRIAKIDPSDGEVLVSFDSPGRDPMGLAWDGMHLWVSDFSSKMIYKLNVNGTIVDSFPSPGNAPMGLAWDGSYLWCVDLENSTVYQLSE